MYSGNRASGTVAAAARRFSREGLPRDAVMVSLLAILGLLAVLLVPAPAANAAEDPIAQLYDPTQIVQIEFTLPQESVDALAADPREYVDATVTIRRPGQTPDGPYPVGIRLKGNAAFRTLDQKAAFLVKFNHSVSGQTYYGLKKLTLNNMVQDWGKLSEAMTYRLARDFGLPSPRTGNATVTVNGQSYGLYLNLENIDKVFAARHFDGTTHVYEGDYTNSPDGLTTVDLVPEKLDYFEVDEGKENNRSDLAALIEAVAGDAGGWWDRVSQYADLSQLVRLWAVEHYVMHWDGYSVGDLAYGSSNNFYLHSDRHGRFSMIPGGTDQTWRDRGLSAFGAAGGGILFRRCAVDTTCRDAYVTAMAELHRLVTANDYAHWGQTVADVTAAAIADDSRKEITTAQVTASRATRIGWAANRPAQLATWLAAPVFLRTNYPPAIPLELPQTTPAEQPASPPATTPPAPRIGLKAAKRIAGHGAKRSLAVTVTTNAVHRPVSILAARPGAKKPRLLRTGVTNAAGRLKLKVPLPRPTAGNYPLRLCAAVDAVLSGGVKLTHSRSQGLRLVGSRQGTSSRSCGAGYVSRAYHGG